MYSLTGKRVFVAGATGMVGSALVRRLSSETCTVLTAGRGTVDLMSAAETAWFLKEHRPDVVLMAAGLVGGIAANDARPADFIHQNVAMAANVIDGAHRANVERLVYFGSSCIYPRNAEQPIREDALLTGSLERTNEAYAIAKIAGVKMCDAYARQYGRDYFSVMPCNLYGPGDNYDPASSHVPAALIRRFYEAVIGRHHDVEVWGTGRARREFLHVDDLADAVVHIMKRWGGARTVNIGPGYDLTIADFAEIVAEVTGFQGRIAFDTGAPEGTPRKHLDCAALFASGWRPRYALKDGLAHAFASFLAERVPA